MATIPADWFGVRDDEFTEADKKRALELFMNDRFRPKGYYPGERLLRILAAAEARSRRLREEIAEACRP